MKKRKSYVRNCVPDLRVNTGLNRRFMGDRPYMSEYIHITFLRNPENKEKLQYLLFDYFDYLVVKSSMDYRDAFINKKIEDYACEAKQTIGAYRNAAEDAEGMPNHFTNEILGNGTHHFIAVLQVTRKSKVLA